MKREIEFRGITFKGDWVYGDLTNDMGGLSFDEKQWIRNNLTENKSTNSVTAYWQETTKRIHWKEKMAQCNAPVKPESVGQFTGLHDKNGTKIFDGDALSDSLGGSVFYVSFERGAFRGVYPNHDNSTYNLSGWIDPNPHLEIIGNIHENPELIKK